jgi:4-diphosphocytidyl-2-C-methyl-D-erythritol kinase
VLTARANGKINLGLEIIGRRTDGHHDIVSILQQIDLGDRLAFRPSESLSLSVDDPSLAGDENLVWRAAELLRTAAGTSSGATITLEKMIPIAAGLGGGSADAAVTLLALNELWDLEWGFDELAPLARTLGSDVAFFLAGGAQLATGRGDCLESLPSATLATVLVRGSEIVPEKTRILYQALRSEDFSDGSQTRANARSLLEGRPTDPRLMRSGFQRVTLERFHEVQRIFDEFQASGGAPLLCGAGPTVMSLHDHEESADRVAETLRGKGIEARVVRTVPGNPWRID